MTAENTTLNRTHTMGMKVEAETIWEGVHNQQQSEGDKRG